MKAALCQMIPKIGDVTANTDTVIDRFRDTDADLIIFPELFLTDYSFRDVPSVKESVAQNLQRILDVTEGTGRTVIVGGPHFNGEYVHNSAYIIADDIKIYDKINLPNFGPFSERSIFKEGDRPVIIDVCGFKIGVIICYDIFFPELTKMYAMNGADAVVCISASPITSNTPFERVFPARSVESTVYMLFVNNTGKRGDMEFFGGSRCLTPTGDLQLKAGPEETVLIAELDHDSIDFARMQRPTLADTRVWMMNRSK